MIARGHGAGSYTEVNSSACGNISSSSSTTCSDPPGIVSQSCTTATRGKRARSAPSPRRVVRAGRLTVCRHDFETTRPGAWDHGADARLARAAWPRHRVRRIRRLGHGAVDQPAPPDVAPGARRTACCSSSRSACAGRSSPGATSRGSSRRLRRGLAPPRAVDGLHVLSPLVVPLHRSRLARALNAPPAARARAARRTHGSACSAPILWAYVPQAEVLIDALRPVARRLPLRR